ncbi:MAG: hypothetical protein VX772_01185, partial [Bacteroidota bacterium]|nr:hypothetical protein [Bacteroidota bacterium]
MLINGSASQGIMTLRHPLVPNDYYIFTTDDALSGGNGFNYAVIDEQGQLKQGSTRLGTFKTTEGIAATFHENGVDIWIMVTGAASTKQYAFLLTCNGVLNNPVVSNLGVSVSGNPERGGVAFNWDGTQFATAFPVTWPGDAKTSIRLYDFDKATGKLSNTRNIAPATGIVPYDICFGSDNNSLYVAVINNKLAVWDVSSGNESSIVSSYQTVTSPGGTNYSMDVGYDGSLYFSSSQGLKKMTSLGSYTSLNVPTSFGVPTIYIPPAEEPDIEEVGPFCDTDAPINLNTTWICSRLNAEDTVSLPASVYSGPGILYSGEGIFDPATAGVGIHEIIFTKCAVDDTIFIEVKSCTNCVDTLKDVNPFICVGESLLLDSMIVEASDQGVWTIDSVPTTATIDAVLDESGSDTLFDASDLTTKPGFYKAVYTVTDGAEVCKDSIY